MTSKEVLNELKKLATHNPRDLAGMARFGIKIDKAWVISIYKLRPLAKRIIRETEAKKRHAIAQDLWASEVHEARILAGYIDEPSLVTESQLEKWVADFDSWDVCDQVCSNLFDQTKYSWEKALEWSEREEEFVKRAGFVLMAALYPNLSVLVYYLSCCGHTSNLRFNSTRIP